MNRTQKNNENTDRTPNYAFKRFNRKNSFCSLECRSHSRQKSKEHANYQSKGEENPESNSNVNLKHHTASMKFCKQTQDQPSPLLKFYSTTLQPQNCKFCQPLRQCCSQSSDITQSDSPNRQIQTLKSQNSKLSNILLCIQNKKKQIEQQLRLSKQQIKRLQRRLDKHLKEKEILKKQQESLQEHIESLERKAFSPETTLIHSYKVKTVQKELEKIKESLQTDKTERERQLQKEVTTLIELKYHLQKQLKNAIVAKNSFHKQLEDTLEELEEVKFYSEQRATRSTEYIELKQHYRILQDQNKLLKEQVKHLQKLQDPDSQSLSLIQTTFLTMSSDSLALE